MAVSTDSQVFPAALSRPFAGLRGITLDRGVDYTRSADTGT